LTRKEFGRLRPVFAALYDQARADPTQRGTVGQRAVGGGCKGPRRTAEPKRLFILVSQTASPRQALWGEGCELSPARVNDGVPPLLPLLQQTLEALEVMPEGKPRQFAHQAGGKRKATALSSEGSDRRRQRPQNPEKQALPYRGKPPTHSDKHVVVGEATTKGVEDLRQTSAGKIPDKKLAAHEARCYPPDPLLSKDTGLQGSAPPVGQPRQPKKSRAADTDRRARSGTTGRWRVSG